VPIFAEVVQATSNYGLLPLFKPEAVLAMFAMEIPFTSSGRMLAPSRNTMADPKEQLRACFRSYCIVPVRAIPMGVFPPTEEGLGLTLPTRGE